MNYFFVNLFSYTFNFITTTYLSYYDEKNQA